MKMKKLLAGVLSAAMVATMIPASMAFSVSAAPEDSLVASYDFTKGETEGWTEYSTLNFTEGDVAQVTQDENGVTFTEEGAYSYTIANPLAEKVTQESGYTIAMDVQVTGKMNEYNGLFGFNNHYAGDFFEVTTNGASIHHNNAEGYYDIVDTSTNVGLGEMVRYVFTADSDSLNVYVNGDLVKSMTAGSGNAAYSIDAYNIANTAKYFNLGFNCYITWIEKPTTWNNSPMTVANVSFYNTALSKEDVASLGAYVPPVVEPDAITASVVDTTAAESYDVGDTFTVDVTAAGNVDLGGYQFTLKYDNTVLEPVLPDDSSDPDVTVSNDGENGIVALKVDLNGENTMVLGEEAITLFSLDFEVIAAPEAGSTELTLADTVFAYYDASGAVQAYDLVPTLNGCTVAIAGTVTYSPYDYNTDGNVDVNDLMALAQMIVNEDTFENASFTYDVNEDTTVDVLDVMTLAQMIVNEEV